MGSIPLHAHNSCIKVTNNEGDWLFEAEDSLIEKVTARNGSGYDISGKWKGFKSSDPRSLIANQYSETVYLAARDGILGVLSEVCLSKVISTSSTPIDEILSEAVNYWTPLIRNSIKGYNYTDFFLYSEYSKYHYTLHVYGFTRLIEESKGCYRSPYFFKDQGNPYLSTLQFIDVELNELSDSNSRILKCN